MVSNSAYIQHRIRRLRYSLPSGLLIETGGLLRIGIKLMMACSTTNTSVYVLSTIVNQIDGADKAHMIAILSLWSAYSASIFKYAMIS